jgi:ATP-dependent 26S proteasome regulatory subunit
MKPNMEAILAVAVCSNFLKDGCVTNSCHAQVCVEAGMLALRRDGLEVNHEDFNEGIVAVQAKKKAKLSYYA